MDKQALASGGGGGEQMATVVEAEPNEEKDCATSAVHEWRRRLQHHLAVVPPLPLQLIGGLGTTE